MKNALGFEIADPAGSPEPPAPDEVSAFSPEEIEALAEFAKAPDKINDALIAEAAEKNGSDSDPFKPA
jgi:hypothetical protein